MEESRANLIIRAQRGDEQAFDELVGLYGRMIMSLCLRIVHHRQDAEDLAQEVFLRLHRSLSKIDPQQGVEAWLVRAAVNVSRSHRERSPSRREEAFEPAAAGSEAPTQSSGLDRAEIRSAIRTAMEGLPPQQKTVFLLRDIQGLATPVVAEALQIQEVTVRRLSSEARHKVVDWLKRHRPSLLSDSDPSISSKKS